MLHDQAVCVLSTLDMFTATPSKPSSLLYPTPHSPVMNLQAGLNRPVNTELGNEGAKMPL